MSIEQYTIDGQDPKIIEKIYNKLTDMMTGNEEVRYIAVQKRPAVTLLPDSITVSDKRIFLCEFTKLGLAMNFEIFNWRDVKDISFKEEIFGSKVTVIPFTGENLTIDYIPKVQARKLYQLIKDALDGTQKSSSTKSSISEPKPTAAEVTPEKSEVEIPSRTPFFNSIENETPVVSHDRPTSAGFQPEKNELDDEITKKLTRLKNLFDRQLISQEEYENKKADILRDL